MSRAIDSVIQTLHQFVSPQTRETFQRKIDHLREKDAYVGGVTATGFVALYTLYNWMHYIFGYTTLRSPLFLTALSCGMAKFYGRSEGIMPIFTDHVWKGFDMLRSQCKPAPTTDITGAWRGSGVDVRWSQFYDERLSQAMIDLFKNEGIKTIWDFGCGQDLYSKAFNRNRDLTSNGLDANPQTIALSNGTASVQDLGVPFSKEPRDCVISLEVGAKIPAEHADQFLKNISDHATKMIILSWPIPGQPGPRQINPQSIDSVKNKMKELGWTFDVQKTGDLRMKSHPMFYWFKQNLLVFTK